MEKLSNQYARLDFPRHTYSLGLADGMICYAVFSHSIFGCNNFSLQPRTVMETNSRVLFQGGFEYIFDQDKFHKDTRCDKFYNSSAGNLIQDCFAATS